MLSRTPAPSARAPPAERVGAPRGNGLRIRGIHYRTMTSAAKSAPARLRRLIEQPGLRVMPCCYDALSARAIERAGFELTFMSGFAVSAARLGVPDTGLISYGEMVSQGRDLCAAVGLPVIGDADTGYGNPANVRRTVDGYARAGFACAMIEDQLAPKRCGHTRGKEVVERAEALARIRAAVDARDEGADILVMARTDARATHGLDEAIWRGQAFADLGADLVFVEAPRTEEEMERVCREVSAPLMANLVEDGDTPWLSHARLAELGFKIAAYPLTLLTASLAAMETALESLRSGETAERRLGFEALRERIGFPEYEALLDRYRSD